jgi:hypothetical protein
MSERDDEIDFDFFEEPEPEPDEQRPRSPLRRAPRGPSDEPPQNYTPLLRLVGAVVAAIVVVVLLVFVVDSCRGDSKESVYADYMSQVKEVADRSQNVGKQFTDTLNQAGIKLPEIEQQLSGLAAQQQQIVARAQDINPPGALRTEHGEMITALQLRKSGLDGMSEAFRQTAKLDNARDAAEILANQANRFVASDVVWDDLFKDPAKRELADRGVTGVAVPDSNFLEDHNLASIAQLRPVWRRIKGATQGIPSTARRGNGIESTVALAQDGGTKTLSTDELTVVKASTKLAFRVAVKNSGDVPEAGVKVTLTIKRSTGDPIVKSSTIESIDQGQTVNVTFPVPDSNLPFGSQTTLTVDVEPVQNEANVENNSFDYPVAFSF